MELSCRDIRHKCCQDIRLSLNSNKSDNNITNGMSETDTEEDVEEITESRRSSSAHEIKNNHKINQAKHSSFLRTSTSCADSEPIVINAAKKPKYSTPPVSDTEPQSRPDPSSRQEIYIRPEPLISRQDPLQNVEKAVVNNSGKRDECDVFAEGWAIMYRKLTIEQRIYAKRLIDDTLMHAQLGQLTISSSLNLDPISFSSNR
ncbi:uncharacterized protein isoform X2 [Musca autumnalis]|uniref:uncharacterized protein isoform X2 n=1 Tax=Musca autumnalis TaxID=221902 RepID=UPI003CEB2B38